MDVSIIVRFHNEAAVLPAVMRALTEQVCPGVKIEIIAMDNRSTDGSRTIAAEFADSVMDIDDYQPGKALNQAIRQSHGRFIVVLSAHAIPSTRGWLRTLYRHRGDPQLAGVYGAQLYPVNARFLDKRDLDIFSTLEPRVETVDSDFWNANALFARSVWNRQPFDETVFELEDHHWTKRLLPLGYRVRFEPAALVYHYGHLQRNDREYLPPSSLPDEERIDLAVRDLQRDDADWPTCMRAGLSLASLTRSPAIFRAVPALGRTLLTHWDFDVRWRVAGALGKIPDDRAVGYLVDALSDISFYARDEAAWSLARQRGRAVEPILSRLSRFAEDVIPFAALALGCSGIREAEEQAIDLLAAELASGEGERQCNAAYFAGEIVGACGSERLVPLLSSCTDSDDSTLLAVSCWALGSFASKVPTLVEWNKIHSISTCHPYLLARFEATVALGKLALACRRTTDLESLVPPLSDPEGRVRYGAMQSIRRLVEEGCSPPRAALRHQEHDDLGVLYEMGMVEQLDSSNDRQRHSSARNDH